MLHPSEKAAVDLLRTYRNKDAPKLSSQVRMDSAPSITPVPPPQPTASKSGLFVFERFFGISNYSLKFANRWQCVPFRQDKANFDRLKLPVPFRVLTVMASAVVVSGFGTGGELHLQLVNGSLVNTGLIQDPANHLAKTMLVFDSHANPMNFIALSSATAGPDLLVKTEDTCLSQVRLRLDCVQEGEFSCAVEGGEIVCQVPKGMTCGQLASRLSTTAAAMRLISVKPLTDPATTVDLSAETNLTFLPNNHLAECWGEIQPFQGVSLIARMPSLNKIIQYEIQLSVVCDLKLG